MKFCAVINSASGNHEGERWKNVLLQQGCERVFELRDTDPQELRKIASECEYVVVGGGDGTASFVATNLLGLECRLLIIPLGTGNDLARELGITKDKIFRYLNSNLLDLFNLPSRAVSIWKITGDKLGQKLFANYFSIGLDGLVIKDFHNLRSASNSSVLRNRLHYGLLLLKNLKYKVRGLQLSDAQSNLIDLKNHFSSLTFANIKSVAGFGRFKGSINASDELLEVMIFKSVLEYFRIFMPLPNFLKTKILTTSSTFHISDIPQNAYFQIDGEVLGSAGDTELRVEHAAKVKFLYLD